MEDVVKKILSSMSSISKPHIQFLIMLLNALMVFQGKATFRNLSRYSELHERKFSRWYQRKFDFAVFNEKLIAHEIPTEYEKIAAIDASFISKSGKCTDGLGFFYNGSKQKAEKGLEMSCICVIDLNSNTAYALDAKQTIDDSQGEVRTQLYIQQLSDVESHLKSLEIKHIAADALYSNKAFVSAVTELGFEHIGRLRIDADLKWLYDGEQKPCGRPKKYDGKVRIGSSISDRFNAEGELADGSHLYSAIVWNVNLKRKIKIVLIHKTEGKKESKVLLFSTDLEIDAFKLVCCYKSRFQIEFIFRDAKQYTGLVDCQSCRKEAIHTHLNASLLALNLMKFEDRRQQLSSSNNVISIASWKRRKFNQNFMENLFCKLGLSPTCEKIRSIYTEFSEYGTIAA